MSFAYVQCTCDGAFIWVCSENNLHIIYNLGLLYVLTSCIAVELKNYSSALDAFEKALTIARIDDDDEAKAVITKVRITTCHHCLCCGESKELLQDKYSISEERNNCNDKTVLQLN